MKKRKPVKHAHRKAMIAQKKAKGKFSKVHLPTSLTCKTIKVWTSCSECWAREKCPNSFFK